MSLFIIVGAVSIMGYLLISDALSTQAFFFLAIIIVLALLMSTLERRIITLTEAMKLSFKFASELQRERFLPKGDIKVEAAELKDIILMTPKAPSVEPDKFYVKVTIEPSKAYLFKISIYGFMVGYDEIKIPGAFRIGEMKERKFDAGQTRVDDIGREKKEPGSEIEQTREIDK
jgi:hypothetical protein